MSNEPIKIASTSLSTADVDPIVLRDTGQVRLIFKPTLVENRTDPTASVRGIFSYQRKRKADQWQDIETIPLNSIKSGEGYKLELKSAETLQLFNRLKELYDYIEAHGGTPMGTHQYVRVENGPILDQVLSLLEAGEIVQLLEVFLKWAQGDDKRRLASALESVDAAGLINFDAAIGAARLHQFLTEAKSNLGNPTECFWQDLLVRNSWVISQVYAFPLVIIREQAYVGGKGIDNAGGTVVDYLYRNSLTWNAVLVEIKTPETDLLTSSDYRNGVYGPSKELGGATQQLLHARQTLQDNFTQLIRDRPDEFNVFSPRALLIIGRLPKEQDATRRRSFETYRNNVRALEIVTFDELLEKVQVLLQVLEQ